MTAQAVVRQIEDSYNEVPYESYSYPQTHPQHIAAIAKLFGLAPPDFKKANVLELGCAAGGNLFPLAAIFPNAKFTGLDFSAEQVKAANAQKETLGIKNVTFTQQDILAFDTAAHKEKFDYIICHGVLSWVPEAVREKILEICGQCLTKEGLAVVSYNTLPGWNAVRSLREMMLYHTGRFQKPAEKVQQARALLEFLSENTTANPSYKSVIEEERALLATVNDSYFLHDHMESVNTQFYFNEFAAMASAKGLTYVGDSAITAMFAGNLPEKAKQALSVLDDVVVQEQYMDFISNRRFRTSILCRAGVTLNRKLEPQQIMDFALSPNFVPETENPDITKPMNFKSQGGASFTTHAPATSQLFLDLAAAAPKPIQARELVQRVADKLEIKDTATVEAALVEHALQLVLRGYLHLHSYVPHCVSAVSEKPVAFPIARLQAAQPGTRMVTTMMGGMINTDEASNTVLQSLDGSKTHGQLVEIVIDNIKNGRLNAMRDGQPVADLATIRSDVARMVDSVLQKLAQQCLLIG